MYNQQDRAKQRKAMTPRRLSNKHSFDLFGQQQNRWLATMPICQAITTCGVGNLSFRFKQCDLP